MLVLSEPLRRSVLLAAFVSLDNAGKRKNVSGALHTQHIVNVQQEQSGMEIIPMMGSVYHVYQERTRQKQWPSAETVLLVPHPLQDLTTASVRMDFSGMALTVYVNNVLKDP